MNIENELNNLKYKIIRSKEVSLEFKKETEKDIDSITKQLTLKDVSQQRELLNALANDFNNSTDTYVGQKTIEKTLKAFNCS